MASAASVTLQSHAQGSSREDGVSAWGIYTGCSQREFLKTFYFEIIVDSRVVIRNTELPCTLYAVFPNGNILQSYTTVSQSGY